MWNVERVAERFREAAETARRLPPVRVQGYFNTWPAILREPWESYAAEDGLYRLPPDAATIERMEETMRWVLWLTEEQRHLVWLRAEERGCRTISRRLGCVTAPRPGGAGRRRYRRSWRSSMHVLIPRA